eukprot:3072217-Pyramimonas_sp.AAC.2
MERGFRAHERRDRVSARSPLGAVAVVPPTVQSSARALCCTGSLGRGDATRGYYGLPRGYYGLPRGYYGLPRGYYGLPRGYYGLPRGYYGLP